MDAIHKFRGLRESVFSETQQSQATPEQAPQQVSGTGIGSAPDAFENFQPASFDFTPLTNPITTENSENTAPAPPQGETVEAFSIFDLLTTDVSGVLLQDGRETRQLDLKTNGSISIALPKESLNQALGQSGFKMEGSTPQIEDLGDEHEGIHGNGQFTRREK